MVPTVEPSPFAPWSRRRRLWFRCGLSLFLLHVAGSVLDTSPATRAAADAMEAAARALGAALAPPVVAALDRLAARSDAHAVVLGLVRDVLLAVAFAGLWSLVDRRLHHERGAARLRVVLRYLVGTVMLVYGGFKVVPVQFAVPEPDHLVRPLGDHTRMSLLWACVGVSKAYTVFGGLGEWVGGLLLFWRRTVTPGALLVAAVMTNVVMLNFCYDIPVKRSAVLLLWAAVVLASRDVPVLVAVLWHRRAAAPVVEPPFGAGPFLRRLRVGTKAVWVTAAAVGPLVAAVVVGPPGARHPLHGPHRLVPAPAVAPASSVPSLDHWRWLVVSPRGRAVVRTDDGRSFACDAVIDDANRALTLVAGSGVAERFVWSLEGTTLRLADARGAAAALERAAPEQVFRVLR